MYLIAGSAVSIMEEILASHGSPLYGHSEVISVSSFNYETSKLFLNEKLKGVNVPDTHQDLLAFITEVDVSLGTGDGSNLIPLSLHLLKSYSLAP